MGMMLRRGCLRARQAAMEGEEARAEEPAEEAEAQAEEKPAKRPRLKRASDSE